MCLGVGCADSRQTLKREEREGGEHPHLTQGKSRWMFSESVALSAVSSARVGPASTSIMHKQKPVSKHTPGALHPHTPNRWQPCTFGV